jgi:hypothetical protein
MKLRKDVIGQPPNFEFTDIRSGKLLSYDLERAIRWISSHPSLQVKFSEIAFRRIDFLESSLWLDHSLNNATRTQYKLELMRLESDEKPIWENVIRFSPQAAPRLIGMTIRAWMSEPIDK